MAENGQVWALILAGGDGTRLRPLTTRPGGTAVPKQFCSLRGKRTLFEDAVTRAGWVTPSERVCTIVADKHRQWWEPLLEGWSSENVIVQPRNRGTAVGILYAVLHILARDPEASIVVLPSDHFVRDEPLLRSALLESVRQSSAAGGALTMLGLEPDDVDPELGYILVEPRLSGDTYRVSQFIEKPNEMIARQIIHDGALWNTLIMAGAGRQIVDLFLQRHSPIVVEMLLTLERARSVGLSPAAVWSAMANLYERLPEMDFSRHILEPQAQALQVLRAPACGWSDIGTPARVGATLERLTPTMDVDDTDEELAEVTFPLNLAAQHAQMMGA